MGVRATVRFEWQSVVVPLAADTTWGGRGMLREPHRGLTAADLGSPPRVAGMTAPARFQRQLIDSNQSNAGLQVVLKQIPVAPKQFSKPKLCPARRHRA